MTLCKCGCGQEVPDGKTWVNGGHYHKWKKKQPEKLEEQMITTETINKIEKAINSLPKNNPLPSHEKIKLREKIIAFIPVYGKRYFRKKAEKEIKKGEAGIVYNAPGQNDPDGKRFQEFLMGLPKYQIEDTFIASKIRGLMKLAGTEHKQVVLIDKSHIHDKKLHVRMKGDNFVHDKGTYFWPCECVKDITYYDIVDSRPLIDATNDPDWHNPEMCADTVTAVTNTKAMGEWNEDKIEKMARWLAYILIAVGISILVSAIVLFQQNQANKEILDIIKKIAERIVST